MTKGDWQYLAVGVVTIPALGWIGKELHPTDGAVWGVMAMFVWFIGAFIRKPVGWFLHLLLTNPRELFNKIVEFMKAALLLASFGAACYGAFLVYSHYDVEWDCVERGNTMLSISEKGDLGPAEKACTCTGMADFERRKFGRVDYASLNKDHGCSFD